MISFLKRLLALVLISGLILGTASFDSIVGFKPEEKDTTVTTEQKIVLEEDYKVAEGESLSFSNNVELDLGGKVLDLNKTTLSCVSSADKGTVIIKNGTITNGAVLLGTANGNVVLNNVTFASSVSGLKLLGKTTLISTNVGSINVSADDAVVLNDAEYTASSILSEMSQSGIDLTVDRTSSIGTLILSKPVSVRIQGFVADVVVMPGAEYSYIEAEANANIANIYVGAQNVFFNTDDGAFINNVKINEAAADTLLAPNLLAFAETVSQNNFNEIISNLHSYRFVSSLPATCMEKGSVTLEYDSVSGVITKTFEVRAKHVYGAGEKLFSEDALFDITEYECIYCGYKTRTMGEAVNPIDDCKNIIDLLTLGVEDFNYDFALDPGTKLGETLTIDGGYIHVLSKGGKISGAVVATVTMGSGEEATTVTVRGYICNQQVYFYYMMGEDEVKVTFELYDFVVSTLGSAVDMLAQMEESDHMIQYVLDTAFEIAMAYAPEDYQEAIAAYMEAVDTVLQEEFAGSVGNEEIVRAVLDSAYETVVAYSEIAMRLYDITGELICDATDFERLMDKLADGVLSFLPYDFIQSEINKEDGEGNSYYFSRTEADGVITYTLIPENLKAEILRLTDELTIVELIEEAYGEGSYEKLKDMLKEIPDVSIEDIVDAILELAEEANVPADNIFAAVNNILTIAMGEEEFGYMCNGDIRNLLKNYANVTIGDIASAALEINLEEILTDETFDSLFENSINTFINAAVDAGILPVNPIDATLACFDYIGILSGSVDESGEFYGFRVKVVIDYADKSEEVEGNYTVETTGVAYDFILEVPASEDLGRRYLKTISISQTEIYEYEVFEAGELNEAECVYDDVETTFLAVDASVIENGGEYVVAVNSATLEIPGLLGVSFTQVKSSYLEEILNELHISFNGTTFDWVQTDSILDNEETEIPVGFVMNDATLDFQNGLLVATFKDTAFEGQDGYLRNREVKLVNGEESGDHIIICYNAEQTDKYAEIEELKSFTIDVVETPFYIDNIILNIEQKDDFSEIATDFILDVDAGINGFFNVTLDISEEATEEFEGKILNDISAEADVWIREEEPYRDEPNVDYKVSVKFDFEAVESVKTVGDSSKVVFDSSLYLTENLFKIVEIDDESVDVYAPLKGEFVINCEYNVDFDFDEGEYVKTMDLDYDRRSVSNQKVEYINYRDHEGSEYYDILDYSFNTSFVARRNPTTKSLIIEDGLISYTRIIEDYDFVNEEWKDIFTADELRIEFSLGERDGIIRFTTRNDSDISTREHRIDEETVFTTYVVEAEDDINVFYLGFDYTSDVDFATVTRLRDLWNICNLDIEIEVKEYYYEYYENDALFDWQVDGDERHWVQLEPSMYVPMLTSVEDYFYMDVKLSGNKVLPKINISFTDIYNLDDEAFTYFESGSNNPIERTYLYMIIIELDGLDHFSLGTSVNATDYYKIYNPELLEDDYLAILNGQLGADAEDYYIGAIRYYEILNEQLIAPIDVFKIDTEHENGHYALSIRTREGVRQYGKSFQIEFGDLNGAISKMKNYSEYANAGRIGFNEVRVDLDISDDIDGNKVIDFEATFKWLDKLNLFDKSIGEEGYEEEVAASTLTVSAGINLSFGENGFVFAVSKRNDNFLDRLFDELEPFDFDNPGDYSDIADLVFAIIKTFKNDVPFFAVRLDKNVDEENEAFSYKLTLTLINEDYDAKLTKNGGRYEAEINARGNMIAKIAVIADDTSITIIPIYVMAFDSMLDQIRPVITLSREDGVYGLTVSAEGIFCDISVGNSNLDIKLDMEEMMGYIGGLHFAGDVEADVLPFTAVFNGMSRDEFEQIFAPAYYD